MAITLVGNGVDDNLAGAAATTFVVDLPAGSAAGDIILMDVLVTGNAVAAPTGVPSGAVSLVAWSSPGGGESITGGLWRWTVPSSPPTTATFTFAAAREGSLVWSSWRGVDNTTPLDAAVSLTSGTNGWPASVTSTHTAPAVTSVTAGTRIVTGLHLGSGSEVVVAPTGTTLSTGGRRRGLQVDRGDQAAPGASTAATFTTTNGYRGRAWQVALRPSASGPPSGAISGVSTSTLTDPVDRWTKSTTRVSWYDGTNWGAVLPTSTGHRLFTNLASPSAGTVVDSRTGSRPTIVRDTTWLGVLRGHPTQSRFSSYNIASSYAALVADAVVPLTPANTDQSPIAMCRSANGYLWAAMVAANKVTVTRSTDNGATWAAVQDVVTGWTLFPTGTVALMATGTSVVLLATGNDGSGRAALSIPQASASFAAASWTTETLPALASGALSDDHLAATVAPDGRVFAVSKTTNAAANIQLIYLLVRSTGGTWTSYNIEVGPDDDGGATPGYTRPNITLTNDQVFVTFGSIYSPQNLSFRTAPMSNPTTWSARTTLLTGPNYWDGSQLPDAAHLYAAAGQFPILAHEVTSETIVMSWRDSGVVAPTFTHAVTGLATSTSIRAKVKVGSATSVRMKVATNTGLTTGVVFGTASTPDANGYAEVECTGLSPWTQYYFGLEITGANVLTTAQVGKAKTLPTPGTPTSFTIAFGSCNDYINPPATSLTAFTNIAARNPDIFVHLGDFTYSDNASTSQASHRADLETTINYNASMRAVLAGSNGIYTKSDHDAGPNNSFPGTQTPSNRAAMLQVLPDLDCPDPNGLYGSRVVGRVKLIVLDTRYFAVQGGTTRIGATQKAWLFNELLTSEPFKIIFTDSAWIDNTTPETGGDKWGNFNAERTEIGNFITGSAVGKVVLAHGDSHMNAADNGSHNSWGGFPTYCGGPFFNYSSIKTANGSADWSQSTYPTSDDVAVSQYAWFSIADAGANITLSFTGYDSSNTSRVTHSYVVTPPVAHSGSVTLSGSGTLAVAGGKNATESVSLSGSGTLGRPTKLTTWANALSSGNATAIVIGDSISEGTGSSTILNRWQSLAQTELQAGATGALFPFLPAWVTAGSDTPVVVAGTYGSSTTAGLGAKGIQLGSTGSVTFTFTGTSAAVLWSTFTTSRDLSVTVDGGAPVTLTGIGSSVLPAVETASWSTGPLTRGVHVVVVTRGAGGGAANPVLNGLLTFDGDETTGIRVIDSARSGTTSAMLGNPVRAASLGQGLAVAGGADLAIIGFGTNDYSVGPVLPPQFRTNLETIIAGLRSGGFTGSILLLGMYMGQGRTLSTWQQYLDEMASLAASDASIDFLNLRDFMPDVPTPYTAPEGEGLYADALHPSDAGHARIASSVLYEITPGLEGGKNVAGSLGLSGSGTLGIASTGMSAAGSRSLSGSGTLGLAGSGSQDAAGSIALSGSGTLGLIGSKSVAGSVALSGSGTLTTAGLPGWSTTLALSGSGTLARSSSAMSVTAAIGLSGSGTLGLVGGKNVTGALGLSGSGTLGNTGAFNIQQTRALSGSGTLGLAASAMSQSGSLNLSGSGLLQPAGEGEQVGSGTFTGTGSGSLTLTGTVTTSGSLSLSGAGVLGLTGGKNVSSSAGFTGSGTLALVTVTLSTAGSRAFSGIGTLGLSGSGSTEGGGSISLSGAGSLGFVGHPTFSTTVGLSGLGSLGLSGSGSGEGTGSITLSGVGSLVFSATEVKVSGSRALTGVGTLTLIGGASSGEGALELSGAGSLSLVGDDDSFEWPAVITLVGVRYSVTLTPVYDGNSLVNVDHDLDLNTTEP